jgi:hypothetical protein
MKHNCISERKSLDDVYLNKNGLISYRATLVAANACVSGLWRRAVLIGLLIQCLLMPGSRTHRKSHSIAGIFAALADCGEVTLIDAGGEIGDPLIVAAGPRSVLSSCISFFQAAFA